MFYSHHLLARKAPLGQIWMAATMHAKINRRSLHKLDIIKICEQILNPSVPMALRLSGILMGGVVIVYERKVKLLYDDVSRLLVEINEAWRVKPAQDRTLLPKSRAKAKYEAVTLPDASEDMEIEQMMNANLDGFNEAASTRLARGIPMKLDELDDAYIYGDPSGADHDNHHQADPVNITIFGHCGGSSIAETDIYNRFERFDIDGDEDTLFKFTQEAPQVPSMPIHSPSHLEHAQGTGEIYVEDEEGKTVAANQQTSDVAKKCVEEEHKDEPNAPRRMPPKRKIRSRSNHLVLDDVHLIIPGDTYQDWIGDCSDLVKKRGNMPLQSLTSRKGGNFMDLPPTSLLDGKEIYYPAPLLELWRKCTKDHIASDSFPGGRSSEHTQEPPSHSPPEGMFPKNVPEYTMEDVQSEIGSMQVSIEKLRANLENMEFHGSDTLMRGESPMSPIVRTSISNPSSGSGNYFLPLDPEEVPPPSGRSKRRQSSSARSFRNLEPVEEDIPLQQNTRDVKLRRLYENGPTPDFELMEETGPTQTPHHAIKEPVMDKITQSIHSHLKIHFDTSGASHSESLEQLAAGMSRKKAAQLFYQTCVLATLDIIKVEQRVDYGDITISRGSNM